MKSLSAWVPDDVLAICFMTFLTPKPIGFPDGFYDVWADLLRIPYKTPPLTEDFRINPADYRGENGDCLPESDRRQVRSFRWKAWKKLWPQTVKSVVIVDEAYVDFGAEAHCRSSGNTIILSWCRHFSKSRNMAELRIGYAMADETYSLFERCEVQF